jgi:SAM-dependent methyltransferase
VSGLRTCLVCGASGPAPLRAVPSVAGGPPFTLYRCGACRSFFFDLHEHGDLDRGVLYNEHSPEVRPFVWSPYWAREVETISRILGRAPASALDVGSRDGSFLLHFPERAERLGVELSLEQAQVAEERGIRTLSEAIEDIDFGRTFDVVSCYAVLEHIPDPLPLIDRLCTLVAPGGVFAVLVPTHRCLKRAAMDALGLTWHHYQPPLHATFFDPRFLAEHIEGRGFALAQRKFTTGGQGPNPFARVPVLRTLVRKGYFAFDGSRVLTRAPVFDHLYLYLRRLEGA